MPHELDRVLTGTRYLGHRGGGLGGLRGAMFALLAAVQILARANDYGEWAAPGVLE